MSNVYQEVYELKKENQLLKEEIHRLRWLLETTQEELAAERIPLPEKPK